MVSRMLLSSIRTRMFVSATVLFLIIGAYCYISLVGVYEHAVEVYVEEELEGEVERFLAAQDFRPDGTVAPGGGWLDPLFYTPYSGMYWQIRGPNGVIDSSGSLLGFELAAPPISQAGRVFEYGVPGPQGQRLILVRHLMPLGQGATAPRQLLIAVSHDEVSEEVAVFSTGLVRVLLVLAVLGSALSLTQIAFVVRPLAGLLPQIEAIRRGLAKRMPTAQRREIAPVARQLNDLLAQQELALERGRARAAGLAHSLKTPLTAIMGDVKRLHGGDQEAIARRIESQIDRINQSVQRELVRTRIRGGAHGVSRRNYVRPMIADVIEAQKRMPGGEDLDWRAQAPADLAVALDTEDLAEIVGNLLDNCRKWARRTVAVTALPGEGVVELRFEDDGRGLRSETLAALLERGRREDESQPGSGIGLAVVEDILAQCGGEIGEFASPLGGLGVRVVLPAASRDRAA